MEEQNEEINKAVEETEEKRQCPFCGSITAYKFATCSVCGKTAQSQAMKNVIWGVGIFWIIMFIWLMSRLP